MAKHLAALKLRSRHSKDDDPVFAARNGKPLEHRNATRRGFEAAAEHAGIDGLFDDVEATITRPRKRVAAIQKGGLNDEEWMRQDRTRETFPPP